MIRKINKKDKSAIIEMMRIFYASDAVSTNGSEQIFESDVNNCLNDNPYLEGYVFDDNGTLQGYAMLAKSYSTEFGKPCIWLEDLYIKSDYRGLGLAKDFFNFISELYSDCIIRLEVEDYNERAVHVYQKAGFTTLPYLEMIKFIKEA